jgi:predicted metal-dependent hydrolase
LGMTSSVVEIEGVGAVAFRRSARARRLILSMDGGGELRVAFPRRVSLTDAVKAVSSDIGWVRRYVVRMERVCREHDSLVKNDGHSKDASASGELIRRLMEMARAFGFSVGKVSVRSQRTRWGSCSANNDISLNVKLAMLPRELTDYVLCHELVHTRVKNHGREFWKELYGVMGDARERDAALSRYRPYLM